MDKIKISQNIFDRYMDNSLELFMECYAETIPIEFPNDDTQECSAQLQNECKTLIKAAHRREKFRGFMKGTTRMLKSVAILAVVLSSASSFLFVTVEAVRNPILDFYIKENDGHWELRNTPFWSDPDNPKFTAPEGGFNEKNPLGKMLNNDEFVLDYIDGNIENGMIAVYYNQNKNFLSLQSINPGGNFGINTENAQVEQVEISGFDGIVSVRDNHESIILTWYNTDIDRFLSLHTDYFAKHDLIHIAEIVNELLAR